MIFVFCVCVSWFCVCCLVYVCFLGLLGFDGRKCCWLAKMTKVDNTATEQPGNNKGALDCTSFAVNYAALHFSMGICVNTKKKHSYILLFAE